MRFITKLWHPNVSSVTGAICLDILKDQWAAAMTLRFVMLKHMVDMNMLVIVFRTVLLSIQALLAAPEPDDPQVCMVTQNERFIETSCF